MTDSTLGDMTHFHKLMKSSPEMLHFMEQLASLNPEISDKVKKYTDRLRQHASGVGPNGLPLDPIINPSSDSDRYVLLPMKYHDIWEMHIKMQEAFWVFNEIRSFHQDLIDWRSKLNDNERHFIKMVLAFFASADGIVNENLVTRFYEEIQAPEARDVYTIQMHIESIHCVHGDTRILTDRGHYRIADMEGKLVNVYNGQVFSSVQVIKTAEKARFATVRLSNGAQLHCTDRHRWFTTQLKDGQPTLTVKYTCELTLGDKLWPMTLPIVPDVNQPPTLSYAPLLGYLFTRGAVRSNQRCIAMSDEDQGLALGMRKANTTGRFVIPNEALSMLDLVPCNYALSTRLGFLRGLLSGRDVYHTHDQLVMCFLSPRRGAFRRANDIRLFLGTLGLSAYTQTRLSPQYGRTKVYVSLDALRVVERALDMSFGLDRITAFNQIMAGPNNMDQVSRNEISVRSLSYADHLGESPSYCFTEPLRGAGTFNGVVTGQSETYSRLIDAYIEDPAEREHIFKSLEHVPIINKKAAWAKTWATNDDVTFGERIFGQGCTEAIFFAASFASIFWFRSRGLLPALSQANTKIAIDEFMHAQFASLIFRDHLVHQKCSPERCYEIVRDAVNLEFEFITEALPCSLIGMNDDLMRTYIESVADNYLEACGLDRIYHSTNPFPFVEAALDLPSLANFFENKGDASYHIHSKTRVIEETDEF
jgi:ribonucleotide reductase beta subunit family protein with ferritin-like domain